MRSTGLSLNTHGGGGEHYPYKGDGAQAMYMMETTWRTRRGVWVMILGGCVRPPPRTQAGDDRAVDGLGLPVIADMDGLYCGPGGASLRSTLPETAVRATSDGKCFIGASFLSNWEAKLGIEHDLVANTMWGDDYPHAEGTWPHTRQAMRFTFHDIDPTYTRQFLGDTAIDVYGLDRGKLLAGRRRDRPDGGGGRDPVDAARGRRRRRSLRVPHRPGNLRLMR